MTTSFYIPPDYFHRDRVTLPADEARHALKVLRNGAGDEIVAVDGVGGWYRIELTHVDARTAGGRILEHREDVGEPPFDLTLAIAVIKQRSRFETFLEKAVELGVNTIAPITTERTIKETIREQRAENILVSAMKQCGRSRMPQLRAPVAFDEFLETAMETPAPVVRLICHEGADVQTTLSEALAMENEVNRITVLIGPEGGFTDTEVERANEGGFATVSLGTRRLRAETAAIAVTAAVMLAYER